MAQGLRSSTAGGDSFVPQLALLLTVFFAVDGIAQTRGLDAPPAQRVSAGNTSRFEFVPVRAAGNHLISGNEILVEPGGGRVWLEVRVSEWDPDLDGAPLLRTIQATLDSSTLMSGDSGFLSPATQACTTNADCVAALGRGSTCGLPQAGFCSPAFLDIQHDDWLFLGITMLTDVSFAFADISVGAANPAAGGAVDDGSDKYLATFVFDISPDAAGSFSVGFVNSSKWTFWQDEDTILFVPSELIPAVVTFGAVLPPCCLPDGSCAHLTNSQCAQANGVGFSGACSPDGNGDGLADSCAGVVSACCRVNGTCRYMSELGCTSEGGSLGAELCTGDGNGNGVSDICEADCNGNGVPNIDEPDIGERDCNLNGVCNAAEIAACEGDPACSDCNSNGIPDGCEADCNANGVPDDCDLSIATSTDCNENDIPDECEGPCQEDCNNNGEPDCCDIVLALSDDCDGNGVPDECQVGGCCVDSDSDGVYESCAMAIESTCLGVDGVFRGPCHPCPSQSVALIIEGGAVFAHVIAAPIDCLGETVVQRAGCEPNPSLLIDPWHSPSDGAMCHNFGSEGHTIPAGFFGEGSDPFASPVCLIGEPLGISEFGNADTLIERSGDPYDRCDPPSVTSGLISVDIRVSELSLISADPIVVTYNGGNNPEQWTVFVDRSVVEPPLGVLTASKTHCNGGTFTSLLNVQPRFTFTRIETPEETRVLDTGLESIPHVVLEQSDPRPWVHDAEATLGLQGDACSAFRAGIEAVQAIVDCDCNGNGVFDQCDIDSSFSQDCNGNGIPDECDIAVTFSDDCNENGIPDECEADCNGNGIPDECDILSAESIDLNENGVPDECEQLVSAPGADTTTKSRYISFRPAGASEGGVEDVSQAFRVTSPDFPELVKWVGPPDNRRISRLQCTPHYQEWGFAMVHVGDRDIIPSKTYVVSAIAEGSDVENQVAYSDPPTLVATEANFGNLVGTPIVNFSDVSAGLDAFRGVATAPPLVVVDLAPAVPDKVANFSDISMILNSFRGVPYPFGDPVLCP